MDSLHSYQFLIRSSHAEAGQGCVAGGLNSCSGSKGHHFQLGVRSGFLENSLHPFHVIIFNQVFLAIPALESRQALDDDNGVLADLEGQIE